MEFKQSGMPEDPEAIRQAALELLHSDRHFNDAIFTPLGAIGIGLPTAQLEAGTRDAATMVADKNAKNAIELLERDAAFDDNKFTPPGAL